MGLTIRDHNNEPVTHGRQRLSTGVRLQYYTAGSGPALMLQHGIPKTSYYWRKVLPFLTPKYTVVVADMRGMGDSTHPDSGYDMATVADDLAELMSHLGHEKFHICGEDWGAAAAYQVAARFRERVLSLVFQEMLLPGLGLEEWAQFDPDRPETHLWHVSFYYVRDVPELLITGREREYFTWFIKNEAYTPAGIDDDAIDEYVSKYSQPGGLRSMFNICKRPRVFQSPNKSGLQFISDRATESNVKQNRETAKKQLAMPVLAVGSEAFIGKEVGKQMERVASQVEYHELRFGHQLAEECPEQLASVYLNFLNAL